NPFHSLREKGAVHPVLISMAGAQRGLRFPINKHETILGRSRNCDFQLNDPGSSRQHIRITYENHAERNEVPSCYVEDLQSRNGTELNGAPLNKKVPLCERDRIKIGRTVLGFFFRDDEELIQEETLYNSATKDM